MGFEKWVWLGLGIFTVARGENTCRVSISNSQVFEPQIQALNFEVLGLNILNGVEIGDWTALSTCKFRYNDTPTFTF